MLFRSQDDDIGGRNYRCHAVDLLNLIAETDSVSTGASSRIAIQDGASEFRAFSPVGIDGTGSGHELPSERFHPCDWGGRRLRRSLVFCEKGGDTEAGENDPAPEPLRSTFRYGDSLGSSLTLSSNRESP